MMMKQPELGKRIADLRKSKGLTQDELVQRCSLNVRTLQRIESGEVMPRGYTIKAIFSALDHPLEIEIEEADPTDTAPSWYSQDHAQTPSFSNKKRNTMKKLSLVAVVACAVVVGISSFMIGHYFKNQTTGPNPLLGKWQLLRVNGQNVHETRTLVFRGDSTFESNTKDGSVYNKGIYSLPSDTTFVTVHFGENKQLAETANLYHFRIVDDTLLYFYGYYMAPMEQIYLRERIDQWWVKVPTKKS